jgi:hypothetical protein
MKHFFSLFLIIPFCTFAQVIPYHSIPDWESTPVGAVSTGLGLGDINGDGWKDIVVANGNDIERQHVVVYYNNGDGTFPLVPDWQSDDIDYHGHLALGDVNNDGWLDAAVSVYLGPDGFGHPGNVKVYYNTGGQLESTPSFESDELYTFSCALGDVDGDGYLDLAVACGEPYSGLKEPGRIYFNNYGVFSNQSYWESSVTMGAIDVNINDMDDNGFADVVFVCEGGSNYIYLASEAGLIQPQPVWTSSETSNFMNSVVTGRMQPGQLPCLLMTGNNQLGGDGKIRQYTFTLPFPSSSAASWTSAPVGYGSGILLADVTRDDTLDLIYGGWWLPMQILVGNGQDFETSPAYTSGTASVVEAIQMADLAKDNLIEAIDTVNIDKPEAAMITLSHEVIEDVEEVQVNGIALTQVNYKTLPGRNLVFLKVRLFLGDQVIVKYHFCLDGDIVISNWDSNVGNYIFYNTNTPTGMNDQETGPAMTGILNVYPNPASGKINIRIDLQQSMHMALTICDMTGREVMNLFSWRHEEGICQYEKDVSSLKAGVYVVRLRRGDDLIQKKLIILNWF